MTAEWRLDKIYQAVNDGEVPGDCLDELEAIISSLESGLPMIQIVEDREELYDYMTETNRESIYDLFDAACAWVRQNTHDLQLNLEQFYPGKDD